MFYIIPKLETFLFANHEAQSIYGYQSLTSYCDMKSANLDLSKVVQYSMFKLQPKIRNQSGYTSGTLSIVVLQINNNNYCLPTVWVLATCLTNPPGSNGHYHNFR